MFLCFFTSGDKIIFFVENQWRKMEKGSMEVAYSTEVAVVVWKDNQAVYISIGGQRMVKRD